MKLSFFAFLVCAFHKEPIELYDFDLLYLKKYLEFLKAVKNNWWLSGGSAKWGQLARGVVYPPL